MTAIADQSPEGRDTPSVARSRSDAGGGAEGARTTYLAKLGIHPNSIPGQACLKGLWDNAPGMIEHITTTQAKG